MTIQEETSFLVALGWLQMGSSCTEQPQCRRSKFKSIWASLAYLGVAITSMCASWAPEPMGEALVREVRSKSELIYAEIVDEFDRAHTFAAGSTIGYGTSPSVSWPPPSDTPEHLMAPRVRGGASASPGLSAAHASRLMRRSGSATDDSVNSDGGGSARRASRLDSPVPPASSTGAVDVAAKNEGTSEAGGASTSLAVPGAFGYDSSDDEGDAARAEDAHEDEDVEERRSSVHEGAPRRSDSAVFDLDDL